jgi:hypothetical protein
MFGDLPLTFQEFAMSEDLPLATVHGAVLRFLQGREDAAVFGAQAVNAYVDEPRMTQDVDILSTRAAELAEELREFLNARFHIAVRIRRVALGAGYRLYQVRKPKNRHLVDVRGVEELPPCNRFGEVLIPAPAELIASKVLSMIGRPDTPKGMTDAADLLRLLLTFPELKTEEGSVAERLSREPEPARALDAWRALVSRQILPEADETEEGD